MKLIQIILILGILSSCSQSQESERAFPNLNEVKANDFEEVHLYLDKETSEVFNKKLKNLDSSHPLYEAEDCESEMSLLAITHLDNSGKKYAIVYGYCPVPEFHIYKHDDLKTHYGSVSGENLYVTGNGFLYASGRISSNFNAKRKYSFKENNIEEVKQPYYSVALKTKTLQPIKLYRTKKLEDVIASLPSDYPIEVVLAESTYKSKGLYLIKTDFGLLGWAEINAEQYKSVEIDGISWEGD